MYLVHMLRLCRLIQLNFVKMERTLTGMLNHIRTDGREKQQFSDIIKRNVQLQ
jgi:hypothetical protein